MIRFALVLFALALLAPAFRAQEPRTEPDAKLVEEAVERLEAAFSRKEEAPKISALQAASEVSSSVVVKAIARGFKEPEQEVKKATVQALRRIDHPDALATLSFGRAPHSTSGRSARRRTARCIPDTCTRSRDRTGLRGVSRSS